MDTEITKLSNLNFEDNEEISLQLGKGEKGSLDEYTLSISSMKKGEISWFEIEDIYFDKNKDRKEEGVISAEEDPERTTKLQVLKII